MNKLNCLIKNSLNASFLMKRKYFPERPIYSRVFLHFLQFLIFSYIIKLKTKKKTLFPVLFCKRILVPVCPLGFYFLPLCASFLFWLTWPVPPVSCLLNQISGYKSAVCPPVFLLITCLVLFVFSACSCWISSMCSCCSSGLFVAPFGIVLFWVLCASD